MSRGKDVIESTAFFTSSKKAFRLTVGYVSTLSEPKLSRDSEVTRYTLETFLSASSTRCTTCCSISLGEAPGQMTST